MPVTGRRLNVEIPHPTRWLSKDQLGKFQLVADYELQNLRNRHASSGVGVPIVICRQRQNGGSSLEIDLTPKPEAQPVGFFDGLAAMFGVNTAEGE